MKRFNRIITLLFVFLLITNSYAEEIEKDKLTVYGKVKVFAKADRAKVSFEIKGYGKSLKNAFESANTQIRTIAEKLSELGLSEKNISTSFFHSGENYGNKAFLSSKKNYKSVLSAMIITEKLDLLESIIVILSENKIERISDITFELIDFSKLRNKALKQAAVKAKEKAEIISQNLDLNLGGVLEFQEFKTYENKLLRKNYTPYNTYMLAEVDDSSPGLFSQEIEFDSEIKVVYEIIN